MLNFNGMPLEWQRNEFMGLNVANVRAAHQILDDPKIFKDPLALRIIGAEAESRLRSSLAQYQRPAKRTFRAGVVVRNRYTEDELAQSIQRGVRQYVILGAGLDTFAYRNPCPWLRVFEVDHPATQAWKRSCLEKAGIPIPESVTYVPVDFERYGIFDALTESGFKSDECTFVSFIGVVRYLSREALVSLLTSIVSMLPAGSEVAFDFGPPPSLLQVLLGRELPGRTDVIFDSSPIPFLRRGLQKLSYETLLKWRFKKNGFRPAYTDPTSLTSGLKQIGFADVQLLGPKELNMRYFKGRMDGLRIRNRTHLAKACV